jgi:hypothetical protein
METFNGKEHMGRKIVVSEARPPKVRPEAPAEGQPQEQEEVK